MNINSPDISEVLKGLVTSETGLFDEEATKRLAEFGHNEIEEVRKKPLYFRFVKQFTHFLAVLLWIAALLSFLSEYLHPGEGMLTLGIAITAVIFINGSFTFFQEYRTEKILEAMKGLLPFYVDVLRNNTEKQILASEVVPGDVVLLSEGNKVPADLRLFESNGLTANNASLTGESEPVERNARPFSGELINSPNIVFAGTTIVSGSGKGVAFATGMSTEFGRIAHLTGAISPGISPLQKEIIKITRVVAAIATVMGIIFFITGYFIGRTFWENFLFAVGIIIANVPEGLLPTVTLSLAMGSQRMAKRKALIKTLTSVETLGSVTVICTDKTGTLTQNKMAVRELSFLGNKPREKEGQWLLNISLLCNNTREAGGELKGEPTETALYSQAKASGVSIENIRLREFPFDPDRKRMSTVNGIGSGIFILSKGAPESIISVCSRCMIDGEVVPFDEGLRESAVISYRSLMDKGLRVLAFAFSEVNQDVHLLTREDAEGEMIFTGLAGLEDPPRPEVRDAIRKCREAGIRVIMLTGDSSRTALAIAREIGLVRGDAGVIDGPGFSEMNDDKLRSALSGDEVIFSRMNPKQKLRVVALLKESGERVAVTGDGVNDAPALKKADIGIAMGITGTDVAKESADMILLDDNFATIVNAIEEGRAVYENIRKFTSYIFSSNIPEIVPYLAYVLFKIPLPLTIMQILAVDLGTDMLPALALGAERPTGELMKQPPRPQGERLLNLKLLSRAYLFLGPLEAAAGLFGFFYVLKSGGWQWGELLPSGNLLYLQATTACLTAIIVTQVANVFACRSFRESVFSIGFFSNKLIFGGIAFEVLLHIFIVYHPWGNSIFSTYPIQLSTWLVLIPFAFLLFFAEEGRKLIVRF